MRRSLVDPQLVAARRGVAAVFLLNAAAFANVVPRLPAIKSALGLSNTALGTAVAAMPVGALVAGTLAGPLVARVGSGRMAVASAAAMGATMSGFAHARSWGLLALTFVVFGVLDAWMDVAMNAHALRVQRGYGRSIINAMHGLWSVGAVLGAAAGALAAGSGLALGPHLALAGAVIAAVALVTQRWLLPGPDDPELVEGADAPALPARGLPAGAGRRLVVLGLLVVLASTVEDAPSSWGAVLLREELDTSVGVAGLAYLAFQIAMTVGRLLADRVVDAVGGPVVVRAGGLLVALGLGAGLAVGRPWSVIVGFAVAGAGAAPLYPLVFHAAGEVPGIRTGHGVAAVAWSGRVGFLLAPPLVGALGDLSSLRAALVVVPVAGTLVATLGGRLAPYDPGP